LFTFSALRLTLHVLFVRIDDSANSGLASGLDAHS
jgi:hypothetical protein